MKNNESTDPNKFKDSFSPLTLNNRTIITNRIIIDKSISVVQQIIRSYAIIDIKVKDLIIKELSNIKEYLLDELLEELK